LTSSLLLKGGIPRSAQATLPSGSRIRLDGLAARRRLRVLWTRLPGGKIVDVPCGVQVRVLDMAAGGADEQPAATRP